MTRRCPIALAIVLACALPTLGQDAVPVAPAAPQEPPAPTPPPLIMREMVVLQADRYGDTANNPKLLTTTLFNPIRHKGRAKRVDQAGGYEFTPMPLGLITFEGTLDKTIKLQIGLASGRGQVHAHWPSNGITGTRSIDWPEIDAADETDRVAPIAHQDDWLDALRSSEDRLWFQSRQGQFKERFLLYDTSFQFKPAIDVAFADGQYSLKTNVPEQAAPPISVLVRKNEHGWASDALAAPWPQTTAPIAKKDSEASAVDRLTQALTPISDLLKQRGYNEQEIELALEMIAGAGFKSSKFALVYVLPVGVIDEHIQLKVEPLPDKVIRTAIVVVTNVDPQLGSQVNALLDDLGSDQWLKRDRAQRELIALGQAAIKKVQPLTNSEDPEVAFRARQILDAYDWKMGGGK